MECESFLNVLLFVDLSHNKIGDSGARGIAKVLATPTVVLEDLKLANNKIGQEGAHSIGKALIENKRLKSIDLRLNHFGDAGGSTFFAALTKNKYLQSVDVAGNAFGVKFVSSLCALLRKNHPHLVSLDVSCNKLGSVVHSGGVDSGASNNPGISIQVPSNGAAPAAAGSVAAHKDASPAISLAQGNLDGDLSGKFIFEAISMNKVPNVHLLLHHIIT